MKKITLEGKMTIKELLEKGKTYEEISLQMEISFSTVRKWGRKHKKKNV